MLETWDGEGSRASAPVRLSARCVAAPEFAAPAIELLRRLSVSGLDAPLTNLNGA
jgi:hypothetical protein